MNDRITEDNLSFDINIINECINEMHSTEVKDKDKYFSDIVSERFTECNRVYMDEFDTVLNNLYDYIVSDEFNMKRIPSVMTRLDKLAKTLYKTQLSLYKIL